MHYSCCVLQSTMYSSPCSIPDILHSSLSPFHSFLSLSLPYISPFLLHPSFSPFLPPSPSPSLPSLSPFLPPSSLPPSSIPFSQRHVDMAIREVFIRFNALLLQDYRTFLRPIDSPANDYSKAVNRLFDAEGRWARQTACVMTILCVRACVRARACVCKLAVREVVPCPPISPPFLKSSSSSMHRRTEDSMKSSPTLRCASLRTLHRGWADSSSARVMVFISIFLFPISLPSSPPSPLPPLPPSLLSVRHPLIYLIQLFCSFVEHRTFTNKENSSYSFFDDCVEKVGRHQWEWWTVCVCVCVYVCVLANDSTVLTACFALSACDLFTSPSPPHLSPPLRSPPLPTSPLPSAPISSPPLPSPPLRSSPLPSFPLPSFPLPLPPLPSPSLLSPPLPSFPVPSPPLLFPPLPFFPLPSPPPPSSPLLLSPLPSPLPSLQVRHDPSVELLSATLEDTRYVHTCIYMSITA